MQLTGKAKIFPSQELRSHLNYTAEPLNGPEIAAPGCVTREGGAKTYLTVSLHTKTNVLFHHSALRTLTIWLHLFGQ